MPCVTHPGSLYGVVTEGRAGPRFGWCGRVHFSGKFFSNNLSQLEGCDSHEVFSFFYIWSLHRNVKSGPFFFQKFFAKMSPS